MKTESKRRSPVWPYLVILACLFVLSVTAPRAWDRMGRQETLSHALSVRKPALAPVFCNRDSGSYESAVASTPTRRRPERKPESPVAAPALELTQEIREAIEAADHPDAPTTEPDRMALEPTPDTPVDRPTPQFVQAVREDLEGANLPSVPAAELNNDVAEPNDDVAELSSESENKPVLASSAWPLPRSLVEQLTRLAEADRGKAWANRTINLIQQLCQPGLEEDGSRGPILNNLRKLAGSNSFTAHGDGRLETQIARAQYTLTRWVDIWEPAAELEKVSFATGTPRRAAERISVCLVDIESLSRNGMDGQGWREYLKVESLRRLTGEGQSDELRRATARKVLDRMASTRLTKSQLKFAGEGPLAALQIQLRAWAAEPVTAAQLLTHVEQYERTGLASDARLVANDFRALSWSAPLAAERISQSLDLHYRNANVRIAMTAAMLNRLIPQPEESVAPVNDTVVNVPVYGRSTTSTKLSVQLVPDPNRIRVGIQAKGLVASDTVATSGPATFRSQGRSNFLVRKLVVIGPHGMSVWPAVAEADNNYNYLTSLETDYDGVPLVGSLVRNMARSKHEQAQGEARMEVEQKVARRARTEFDAQVKPLLVKAAENIEKREMATLDRLGLEIVPVEFSTTEQRIMARVRLATPEQLGAHTPRPRAPSDSWYSLQLHESALNNVMEQLNLNGRKFELPQLFAWIAEKLDRPQMAKLDDLPDDVNLTFAKQDAVRVRCEAGRIEVILSFAALTQGRNHWHDFTVRTFYKPEPRKSDAQFVRDDTIHLEGRSLKGKPQVMLRTIFSKVLSVNRPITMVGEKITGDPRIQDLKITQFTVDDGWIAVAYSPSRAPANVVRRPK